MQIRKKKNIMYVLVFTIVFVVLTGAYLFMNKNKYTSLTIIAEGVSISYSEDSFKDFMDNHSCSYVELNTDIYLKFLQDIPDTLSISNYILRADGTEAYTEKEDRIIEYQSLRGDEICFTLTGNPSAF